MGASFVRVALGFAAFTFISGAHATMVVNLGSVAPEDGGRPVCGLLCWAVAAVNRLLRYQTV